MKSESLGPTDAAPNVVASTGSSAQYTHGRRLRLKFIGEDAPDIHRIEYVDGNDAAELFRERSHPDDKHTLRGLKMARVLSLFFLEYRFWESEETFRFSNSVSNTLYEVVSSSKGDLPNLIAWAKLGNPSAISSKLQMALKPRRFKNRECVTVNTNYLPRDCIEFYWDRFGESALTERTNLEKLARCLRRLLGLDEPSQPPVARVTVPIAVTTSILPEVPDVARSSELGRSRSVDEIPKRVWLPVSVRRNGDTDQCRRNFAVRYALSQRAGAVVVHGDSAERVFECLVKVEAVLEHTLRWIPEHAGIFPRRWLRIDPPLRAGDDFGTYLNGVAAQTPNSPSNASALDENRRLLGLFVQLDRTGNQPGSWRNLALPIVDWVRTNSESEVCLVLHTQDQAIADAAHALVKETGDFQDGFPPELVALAAEANSLPEVAPIGVSFWNHPAPPGYALARICQIADPEARSLRLPAYSLLATALRGVSQPQIQDVGSTLPPLPEEVMADIHRVPTDKPQIVRLVVRLLKQSHVLRSRLTTLVRLLASTNDIRIRLAVVNEAMPDWDLLDAWLDALAPEVRRTIASWWISTEPAALPAVLATLFRSLRRGDKESGAIIRDWAPLLSARLQAVVNIALHSAEHGTQPFWASPANSQMLSFMADCDLVGEVPFAQLSPGWNGKAEFWEFLQRIPLSAEMVTWALAAAPAQRATIGLCSNPEWTALSQMHLLPQIFARRG